MEPIGKEQEHLFAKTSTLWTTGEIEADVPVCFQQSGFASERAWVKDAVMKSWYLAGNITFSGWNTCPAGGNGGLRIKFQDAGGKTLGLGSELVNKTDGVQLNTWVSSNCVAGWTRERCVRSTAVHEFGHAIGWAHEQNRDDTPASCTQAPQGENGNLKYGAWDINSVMNYCNPIRNGDGILSATDKAATRYFYGPFTVPCPNGLDSTCEPFAPTAVQDFDLLNTNGSPWWTTFAMNGYGKQFTTRVAFLMHNGYWTLKFSGPQALEMPTLDTHYDFTRFNANNMGCIAFDTTAQQDSMAQLRQGGSNGCDLGSTIGYGADHFPRYLSTHYNRDASLRNGADAWAKYPRDNQPITLTAAPSGGGTAWIDLIQVKVKYGRIDIYSDARNGGNGVLGATPDVANLGPGTNTLTSPIWSATKIVFTARGASATGTSSNVDPAAIEQVVIGQP